MSITYNIIHKQNKKIIKSYTVTDENGNEYSVEMNYNANSDYQSVSVFSLTTDEPVEEDTTLYNEIMEVINLSFD